MRTRCYTELSRITTFEERYNYLSMPGEVGRATFGFDRWINQQFYASREWKLARMRVIARDLGCDLGFPGYEVYDSPLVHHMNPLTVEDIYNGSEWTVDPEFLITTSKRTHNAIHYGDRTLLPRTVIERQPGDTALW
jgi:hypothetical protein